MNCIWKPSCNIYYSPCVLKDIIWKSSAHSPSQLSAAPVGKDTFPIGTTVLTDARNASYALKVTLKHLIRGLISRKRRPSDVVKMKQSNRPQACGWISFCSTEYAEKCTPTTDAKCSCRNGFLCSNNACSKCEEKKCVTGEKVKRTGENGHTFVNESHMTR